MALRPTIWNAASVLRNGVVDADGLTWSTSGADTNRAWSVAAVATGKYYWELLVNSVADAYAIGAGVDDSSNTSGNSIPGEPYSYPDCPLAAGDVVGFLFDAGAGELIQHKNGVTVSTTTGLTTQAQWRASVSSNSYGATSATANFGASAFAYAVPSGYQAGFGVPGIGDVAGFKTTMFGTPLVDYPPVIHGFKATLFGAGAGVSSGLPVISLFPQTAFGMPHLAFSQSPTVDSFYATAFANVGVTEGPSPATQQNGEPQGFLASRFGVPTATGAVAGQVVATLTTQFGQPVAGKGYPVAGFQAAHYGAPTLGLTQQGAGACTTIFGMPLGGQAQPVSGFAPTKFGTVRLAAYGHYPVPAWVNNVMFGNLSLTRNYPVLHLPPDTHFGTPLLQELPC